MLASAPASRRSWTTSVGPGVDIRAAIDQGSHNLRVREQPARFGDVLGDGVMQRRPSGVVAGLHVGVTCEQ
jgi:hypothetical protein